MHIPSNYKLKQHVGAGQIWEEVTRCCYTWSRCIRDAGKAVDKTKYENKSVFSEGCFELDTCVGSGAVSVCVRDSVCTSVHACVAAYL